MEQQFNTVIRSMSAGSELGGVVNAGGSVSESLNPAVRKVHSRL